MEELIRWHSPSLTLGVISSWNLKENDKRMTDKEWISDSKRWKGAGGNIMILY